MNSIMQKMLWVAAGAAVGAVGYMAIRHPDELKKLADKAVELGQTVMEKKMDEMAEQMAQSKQS